MIRTLSIPMTVFTMTTAFKTLGALVVLVLVVLGIVYYEMGGYNGSLAEFWTSLTFFLGNNSSNLANNQGFDTSQDG